MPRRHWISFLLLVASVPLHAQVIRDSQTVRVRGVTPRGERRFIGRLELVTRDSVTILSERPATRVTFNRSAITGFERWAGTKSAAGRGAGMGLGLGLMTGAVAGLVIFGSEEGDCADEGLGISFRAECAPGLWILGTAVGGGVLGAVVGGAIGSGQTIDRWRRDHLPVQWTPQIVLGPGRAGLRLTLPSLPGDCWRW